VRRVRFCVRSIFEWIRKQTQRTLAYLKRVIHRVVEIDILLYMRCLVLAFLLSSAALGQSTKTDIAIHCASLPEDVVGGQLCSALRDAVAKSTRFREAARNPEGWQLRIATTGIDDNKGSAVSMTLVYHALYVVNTVQVCGASVIPDCAQGMLSDSDDHIRLFEQAVKNQIAKQ
jgi:hypothetical protein